MGGRELGADDAGIDETEEEEERGEEVEVSRYHRDETVVPMGGEE